MSTKKSLLINWVYYQPVGHAIEALRWGQAFRNCNPDMEIAIALNARTALELGECLPAIDAVYPIDLEEFALNPQVSLESMPRRWDYVFTDPRQDHPTGWDALDQFARVFHSYIHAGLINDGWRWPTGFPHTRFSPVILELPPSAQRFATDFISEDARTRICVLLGSGTDESRTPPVAFWRKLFRLLLAEFEDAEIFLLGAFKQDRSFTKGLTRTDILSIVQEFPPVRDAFDRGLLNQLAITERCDLCISPHTGMSFAVQCVGTPWLALSGGEVAEHIVNGVPFVCIYPDCDRYPCGRFFAPQRNPMLAACERRRENAQPFLCMTGEKLEEKLPQILDGARCLIRKQASYLVCVDKHYREMIPRLGKQAGEPFLDGWPWILAEDFVFDKRK